MAMLMLHMLLLASVSNYVGADATTTTTPLTGSAAIDSYMENLHSTYVRKAAVTAGDESGRKYHYDTGGTTLDDQFTVWSVGKFPATLAIAGAIADGCSGLTFDTKVSDFLEWWTTDPTDKRSNVTMRSLLNFASGWAGDDSDADCYSNADDPWGAPGNVGWPSEKILKGTYLYTPEQCAKQYYDLVDGWKHSVGEMFTYRSAHQNIAATVAMKACGLENLQVLTKKYLIDKVGLTCSYWSGGGNPTLATGYKTTARDNDKLLHAIITNQVVPKSIMDTLTMSAWVSYPHMNCCGDDQSTQELVRGYEFWGGRWSWSMGIWTLCKEAWTDSSEMAEKCSGPSGQMSNGANGYVWYFQPTTPTKPGYYFQLALNQPNPNSDCAVPTWLTDLGWLVYLDGDKPCAAWYCLWTESQGLQVLVENLLFGEFTSEGFEQFTIVSQLPADIDLLFQQETRCPVAFVLNQQELNQQEAIKTGGNSTNCPSCMENMTNLRRLYDAPAPVNPPGSAVNIMMSLLVSVVMVSISGFAVLGRIIYNLKRNAHSSHQDVSSQLSA